MSNVHCSWHHMEGLGKGSDARESVMRGKFDGSRHQAGGSGKGCDARVSVMRAMSPVPGIRWAD